MSIELTRREVLQASAALMAGTMLGWYIPGSKPRVKLPDEPDILPIPDDVNEVVMMFGAVVAATSGAIDEKGLNVLRHEAFTRARRCIPEPPEIEGWIAEECISDVETEVEPGGDHWDPLQQHHLFGVKQQWRMVRA